MARSNSSRRDPMLMCSIQLKEVGALVHIPPQGNKVDPPISRGVNTWPHLTLLASFIMPSSPGFLFYARFSPSFLTVSFHLPCRLTLSDESKGSLERKGDETPMAGSSANGVVATEISTTSGTGGCIGVMFPSSSSSMLKMEILEKIYLAIDGDLFAK
ncbi:hypothetical protein Fot_32398 [Forsythia ovata]|uniref:Uncharacterized protein n=1 Tax=Forsythia ovata TaxID=205694 RepID=A0ABD1T7Y3_9LAMI